MTETHALHQRQTAPRFHQEAWPRLRGATGGPLFYPLIVGILVCQAAVVAYLVHRSYFAAEDFTYLQLFRNEPLSVDLLRRSIFGHLIPGYVVLNKYYGTWLDARWLVAGLITVFAQVAQTVAFTRLVVALRGRRWWVPWTTFAFGLSVVMLNTAPWWAATATIQIALGGCVSAWGCAVRYARTRRRRHLLSLTVMFLIGVAFWEKSIVTCAYLGLFVLIIGIGAPGTEGCRARLRQAVALWPVWLVMGVIAFGDLIVYSRGPYIDSAGSTPSAGQTLIYLVRSTTEGLFPSVFGMIYPRAILPGPSGLSWILPTLIIVAVALWTAWRSPLGRRAWLWFLVADVVSQIFVARGRLTLMGTAGVAHDPRYELDATYLFLIAAVIAVPAAVGTSRSSLRGLGVLALGAPILASTLWLQSVQSIVQNSPGTNAQTYLSPIRSNRIPMDASILDVPFPNWIVPSNMYPWNMSNRILPLVRPGTKLTHDPSNALFIRPDGTFGKVVLNPYPGAESRNIDTCVRHSDGRRTILELTASVPPMQLPWNPLMLAFDVRSSGHAKVQIVQDGPEGDTFLRGNVHPYSIPPGDSQLAVFVHEAPLHHIQIAVKRGAGKVCVTGASLVTPTAK